MSPRWLHWPASVGVVDWDTYKDGIAVYAPGGTFNLGSYVVPTSYPEASVSYELPGRIRMESGPPKIVRLRATIGEMSIFAPFIAIEHESSGSRGWYVGQYDGGGSGAYTYVADSEGTGAFKAFNPTTSPFNLVLLSQDPGDPTGWSAFA
jgi:hypothetical protein